MTVSWNKVGLAVGIAAVASVILHLSGCAEEQLTGVPNGPPLVIRGGSCVPEVISEVTDSTESALTTFTATLPSGGSSCSPNLVAWGIDMYDPVGVDTPQGTSYIVIRTPPHPIANAPSPGYAGVGGDYTPPRVVVEFDPPVQSVDFYYSRRAGARAFWGTPGSYPASESTAVYVTSGYPIYQQYDRKVLYTNSSSGRVG